MARAGAVRNGLIGAGAAFWLAACAGVPAPALTAEPAPLLVPVGAPVFDEAAIAALEARMAAYVEQGAVKGIATRLVRDGEVISDVRAGIRREADAAPVSEDTIWRIYSMSKPVTGVALLMLWEEGAFDLDDPITEYFPEFEGLQVFSGYDEAGQPVQQPVVRPPTIRQLMSHTAGFGYGLRSGDYVNDRFREADILAQPDMQAMIDAVAGVPLMHEPGQTWAYSISVDIQGALIERLSRQTLGEFLRTRLFEPLGMTDTGFFVPDEAYSRLADLFVWAGGEAGWAASDAPAFQYREDTIGFEAGGHGLVSTMDDYARFAAMLANGGSLDGTQILQPETIRLMATNVLPEGVYIAHDGVAGTDRAGGGFGLNVGVVTDAEAANLGYPDGTYMWGGAAGTWFWIDPVNKLYFIGMVQRFGAGPAGFAGPEESARLVYQALRSEE